MFHLDNIHIDKMYWYNTLQRWITDLKKYKEEDFKIHNKRQSVTGPEIDKDLTAIVHLYAANGLPMTSTILRLQLSKIIDVYNHIAQFVCCIRDMILIRPNEKLCPIGKER